VDRRTSISEECGQPGKSIGWGLGGLVARRCEEKLIRDWADGRRAVWWFYCKSTTKSSRDRTRYGVYRLQSNPCFPAAGEIICHKLVLEISCNIDGPYHLVYCEFMGCFLGRILQNGRLSRSLCSVYLDTISEQDSFILSAKTAKKGKSVFCSVTTYKLYLTKLETRIRHSELRGTGLRKECHT